MLTKDQILNASDLEVSEVQVPEWGGSVYVRVLSIDDARDLQQTLTANGDDPIELFILVTCDENGTLLFTRDEAQALRKRSFKAINRIIAAANKVNGFTAKAVDTAEGN